MVNFNAPCRTGKEEKLLLDVAKQGKLSHGGRYTQLLEKALSDYFEEETVLTSSCTHALEICALALKSLGDNRNKVVVPSYAYVSSANAFALHGFEIEFCDVDPQSGNLDLAAIKKIDLSDVVAVVVLHYAGIANEPLQLSNYLSEKGVFLIEDNAMGLGANFDGKKLGTFGDLSCLSFHETKIITGGEGGALTINNPIFSEVVSQIRNKGTNREAFDEGKVDKYTWTSLGSAYLPSELQAAAIYAQFKDLKRIVQKRQFVWEDYYDAFSGLEAISLPSIPDNVEHNASTFYLLLETEEQRDELIAHLNKCGVMAVFHYQALHESPFAKDRFSSGKNYPASSAFARKIVRLPLYYNLTEEDKNRVIDSVQNFYQ